MGVNTTPTVPVLPAATLVGTVPLVAKSPVADTPLIVSEAVPGLLRVKATAGLLVLMVWLGKP